MSKLKYQKPKSLKKLRVAIVVEELTQLGGAERVLDAVLEIFPKAPIYALVYNAKKTDHIYDRFDIRPSFIQKLPFGSTKYKWYLPLMPWAVESFDFKDYDLVISITSALVKGVKTSKDQVHICFCNTPTRYLWLDSKSYIKNAPIPFFILPLIPSVIKRLKKWDLKASKHPDYYIANSENVKKRIKKYYNRSSDVIYPPIDITKYKISKKIDDYYLIVSRIEPYKKVDLVIKVFNKIGLCLKIVGSGTKKGAMEREAKSNIEFLGRLSDKKLAQIYSKAKAIIFPQEEDFGLVPLEAMASGRPVIAFRKGGALETVIPGETGEFFSPQTEKALRRTIINFNNNNYHPAEISKFASTFDKTIFKEKLINYINSRLIVDKKT